jgi:hypothetical protein
MGFNRVAEVVDAALTGAETWATWRKSPSQATTQGVWFDLSMSPGNPVPQYYAAAPLVSVAFRQSTDGGIYHGAPVAPKKKYLRELMQLATAATALPMAMILCDYLLYYPFLDDGTTDEQAVTNSVALPRYATGQGVQMIAVSVAGRTGGQQFRVNYTNQDGVSGRVSQNVLQNTVSVNGSIVTSAQASDGAAGPFIPLQRGDTGVRYVESVTMLGADVGLFAIVLVKPIAQTQLRGIDAPVEVDYLKDFSTLPEIVDDAYLNFLCLPMGAINATALHGMIRTCWG